MMGMTGMMWLMLLSALVIGLLLIAGAVLFVRLFWNQSAGEKPKHTAESILRERFARGEIDQQEYQARMSALQRRRSETIQQQR